jgi:protease-4
MWNKLGVTWKGYQRGANAGLLSSARPFNEAERKRMQAWMDEVYGVFKGHVTAIRGDRLKKDLDELAGGRVYTGKQALELGLIDKIGTLDDAIGHVAKEAKLADYEVRVVPEPKGFLELLLESAGDKADDNTVSLDAAASFKAPATALARDSAMLEAALPLLKGLDPQRMRAVLRSLRQLETLRQEGVVLMTPEFVIQR